MITKEQAMDTRIKYFVEEDGKVWRRNGKCKTWKTRPEDFELPVKHGLRNYGYITHNNASSVKVK